MPSTPNHLYHYTVAPKLKLILQSGILKPTGYAGATSRRERPILWFSSNPLWELTAAKIMSRDGKNFFRPTVTQLHEAAGCVRFRLDCTNGAELARLGIKLHPWQALPVLASISPRDVRDMIDRALKVKAVPTEWWGSFEAVLVDQAAPLLALEELSIDGDGKITWAPTTLPDAIAKHDARNLRVYSPTTAELPAAHGL